MFARLVAALAVLLVATMPAAVRAEPGAGELAAALRLSDLVDVMREEGLSYGQGLEGRLFPGRGGKAWRDTVARLYDRDTLRAEALRRFEAAMPASAVGRALAFFDAARGRRITSLEISARRALREPDVKDSAGALLSAMVESRDAKLTQIVEFVQVNNIVELNVVASMKADTAFYRGLVAGHAKGFHMSDAEIQAELGGARGDIQRQIQDWLFPYLAMSFEPLSEADVSAYVDFSRTTAGRAVNAALFEALGDSFAAVSGRLGQAVAPYLSGSSL